MTKIIGTTGKVWIVVALWLVLAFFLGFFLPLFLNADTFSVFLGLMLIVVIGSLITLATYKLIDGD